ncbi:hypothetical protein [Halobacillus sp. Marseille-Q1614]|uniref:hypothetical protein n=1 Tax=Halobacillus sp. Marseille-Q1614 TaxID=2709134 RepID=UPI00156D5E2F|nr:hypothetical protein [Halobacillus sp. Marseille-Q1614]
MVCFSAGSHPHEKIERLKDSSIIEETLTSAHAIADHPAIHTQKVSLPLPASPNPKPLFHFSEPLLPPHVLPSEITEHSYLRAEETFGFTMAVYYQSSYT